MLMSSYIECVCVCVCVRKRPPIYVPSSRFSLQC